MEFFIPTTLVGIISAVLIGILVIARILQDMREVRRSRNLMRRLVNIGKLTSMQKFSAIVELDRRPDSIIPLLDHIYEQNYKGLQIIVVIKHTAGKNAQVYLGKYRRSNKRTNLRLVKHTAGLTVSDVVRKYATGQMIIRLDPDHRLSPNFFADLSLDFVTNQNVVIKPRLLNRPYKSIASGLKVHFTLWSQALGRHRMSLANASSVSSGFVYKKQQLAKQGQVVPVIVSNRAYIMNQPNKIRLSSLVASSLPETTRLFRSTTFSLGLLAVIAGIVTVGVITSLRDAIILMIVMAALYFISALSIQLQTKGYSIWDHINLALLIPFGLLYGLLLVVITPFVLVFKSNPVTTASQRIARLISKVAKESGTTIVGMGVLIAILIVVVGYSSNLMSQTSSDQSPKKELKPTSHSDYTRQLSLIKQSDQ